MAELFDMNDQAVWDSLYDPPYTRATKNRAHFQVRAIRLGVLGVQDTDTVLVLGAGFGWLVEELHARGVSGAIGLDRSTHIQSNLAGNIGTGVTVVDADFTNVGQAKARIRQANGGVDEFDWVVTEDVFPMYPDADHAALLDDCEAFLNAGQPLSNIIHVISQGHPGADQESALNWKSLAEWNAIRPTHTWGNRVLGQVL